MIAASVVEIVHSAPGCGPGDDAFGTARTPGALHAWVIDGATSVSDRPDKVIPGLADPAWFARSLSAEIARIVRFGGAAPGTGRLSLALGTLTRRFEAAVTDPDPHDYPVAAMTYLRITRRGALFRIDSLAFADCFFALTKARRGARRIRPLPAPLVHTGLTDDPETLARLRRRRAAQNSDLASTAITLNPRSLAHGRRSVTFARPNTEVLLGSDGYARLWTEYALASKQEIVKRTARYGALEGLVRLRDWERLHENHGLAPKGADDVTALRIHLGRPQTTGHWKRHGQASVWAARPLPTLKA